MNKKMYKKPVFVNRLPQKQSGAVLVETAITLSLFMVLVMGIFEFTLLIFDWARAVEVTRNAARLMVVNTPPVDLSSMDCEFAGTHESFNCAEEDCGAAWDYAENILPRMEGENLIFTYSCTTAGYKERPEEMPVYMLTAEIQGYTSRLRIPALVGFPADLPMPGFSTSRVTEDMHTP